MEKSPDYDHPAACRTAIEAITRRCNHFLCCVDGSAMSDIALSVTVSIRNKHDYVTVFHAYRNHQEQIPDKYKSDALREHFSDAVDKMMPAFYSSLCFEPRGEKTMIEVLQSSINGLAEMGHSPTFIVMGFTGRKSGVGRVQEGYFAPLSSNCENVLRTIPLPVVIAKKDITDRKQTRRWLMAVDGSPYSARALDILLRLISPKDHLTCFYVMNSTEDQEHVENMRRFYEEDLELYGPLHSSFDLVEMQIGVDLKHTIVDYVNSIEPDFMALGPRARPTLTLTALTKHILDNVSCSLVVCKN